MAGETKSSGLLDQAHVQRTLDALLETSPEIIVLVDQNQTVEAVSPKIAHFFALDPSAAPGMKLDDLLQLIGHHNREDPTLHVKTPVEAHLRVGQVPIIDDAGAVVGEIWMFHDITEARRARIDLEHAQARQVQSEKMASLGMLVAGIAHEINTPIGAVSSMLDTLVKAIDKLKSQLSTEFGDAFTTNTKIAQTLKIIDDSTRVSTDGSSRVLNIVRRIKSFARLDEADLKDADINEGIGDTLTLIQHELKRGIKVVRDFGVLPPIACYPGRLNQVFLNMLMNARQAIGGRGEIRIQTRLVGDVVRIAISDTGVGISPANLEKIFEAGFTTKGVGVGTGLGLSICHQIVEDHSGRILVDSEEGKGTTFTVEIPAHLSK